MRLIPMAGALLVLHAGALGAQDVGARVAAVREGRVELRFASREGVCGDGRNYVRLGNSSYGHFDGRGRERPCVPGPVRVVATVAGGEVTELRSYVGPDPAPDEAGITDLGTVPAVDGARWLMRLARTSGTRAASRAIMPAAMADSAVIWPDLLAIARDESTRSTQVRRDASFWLGRFAEAAVIGKPNDLAALEEERERAPGESDEVEAKKQAVFALSQLRGGEGVPPLLTVARTHKEPAVRRQAMFWLGQSGDPRAIALFEEILRRP